MDSKSGRKKRTKKYLTAALDLSVLLLLMYLVFHKNGWEILGNIRSVSGASLLLLLGMALAYLVLDAEGLRCLLKSALPSLTFTQAFELELTASFCSVATFSAGTVPVQSYYLYRLGMAPGDSIGLLIVKYILHKAVVVLCSFFILLFSGRVMFRGAPELLRLSWLGWGINAVILTVMILLSRWDRMRALAVQLAEKLPDSEKWQSRRESLLKNIEALCRGVRSLSGRGGNTGKAFLLNILKLPVLYLIPWAALRAMGCRDMGFWLSSALMGVTHVIATALPNIAGAGPTEAAFLILYSAFIPRADASSALVLYRFATYFFPFLAGAAAVYLIRRRLDREKKAG